MAYKHDARNVWASQTIKKTNIRRSNSSLSAYPALQYSQVRIKTNAYEEMLENTEISRTVPRSKAARYDFSIERSVLKRLEVMENQDIKMAENRMKLVNSKKLQTDQAETFKQMQVLNMERKIRKEEAQKIGEQLAEEKENEDKLSEYETITGEYDRNKNRPNLEKYDWNLEKAIDAYMKTSDEQPTDGLSKSYSGETLKIIIYVGNKRHEWTKKATETLWDLYTSVARLGKNEAFHFVDLNGKKYREHMFETTFEKAGWVPEVTLTVCRDIPKR